MRNTDGRSTMLTIAAGYEKLERRAEATKAEGHATSPTSTVSDDPRPVCDSEVRVAVAVPRATASIRQCASAASRSPGV